MQEAKQPYEDYTQDDHTTRYTRRNIKAWLLWWPDIFETEIAERSIIWAMCKADVLLAIGYQTPALQKVFVLVGKEQMTFWEAGKVLGVGTNMAKRYFGLLVKNVCNILMDSSTKVVAFDLPEQCTNSQAVTYEGLYPCNPDRR